MWQAIDLHDAEGLEQALQEGASPRDMRHATPPIWACVERGYFDLAHVLKKHGARLNVSAKGMQGGNLWGAIAKRNNPEEARQLKELLGSTSEVNPKDFINYRSYDLLTWWMEEGDHQGMNKPCTGDISWNGNDIWILASLYGPENVWDFVNNSWGIDPTDPSSLSQRAGPSTAQGLWEEIIRRDDVALAQKALQKGWGPPAPQDYGKHYKKETHNGFRKIPSFWRHSMGWAILAKKSENLWAWWTQQPNALTIMQEESRAEAAREETSLLLIQSKADIERLTALGLFDPKADAKGNLLAHGVFMENKVSSTVIRWWAQNRPHDFSVENDRGKTPTEVYGELLNNSGRNNRKVVEKIRQELINAGLPPAAPDAPKKQRF